MPHSHSHRPICWRQFLHSSAEAPSSQVCHLETHHRQQPSQAAASTCCVISHHPQGHMLEKEYVLPGKCDKKWTFTQNEETDLPQTSYFTTAQTSENAEKWCISPYYLFSTHLQDTFHSHLLVANSLIASSYDNNFIVFLFAQRGKEDNCFVDWSVFLLLMLFCAKHTVSRRFLLCVAVLRIFVPDLQDRRWTFFTVHLVRKETG